MQNKLNKMYTWSKRHLILTKNSMRTWNCHRHRHRFLWILPMMISLKWLFNWCVIRTTGILFSLLFFRDQFHRFDLFLIVVLFQLKCLRPGDFNVNCLPNCFWWNIKYQTLFFCAFQKFWIKTIDIDFEISIYLICHGKWV